MSAAVLTAGVPALAVCVIVVVAPDIGVVAERPRQQCVYRRVRLAADAAVEPDARLCQRRLRATADTAADQGIHALLHQKARQYAVPTAVGIHDLCTDNLAFRDLIELKLRGVTKVLENLSPPIGQCHLVSKEGTSQRQHTAKRKQAVCCFCIKKTTGNAGGSKKL